MTIASVLLAAAEAAEKKAGIETLFPDVRELVVGIAAFVVLFLLLQKVAIPALKKSLDQRAETIQNDLERAEQAKLEAEQVLREYREQLGKAREEAAKIIEEGRKTADDLKKDILAKAEDESKAIIDAGKRDVQNAIGTAQVELRRQMADLSVDLAGRIIGKQLDAAAQAEIIDQFVRDIDAMEARS